MDHPLLAGMKLKIKSRIRQLRLGAIRRFQGFGADELIHFLHRLGVEPGQVVMVHGSWEGFEGFDGTPKDLIGILQRVVGEQGTLLMPTLPFSGLARDWVEGGQVFDVRRTPSRMGMVTELFRRSPGVIRSVHPTHPVAAWGRLAREITRDHHRCLTPCGAGSPYARMLEYGGQNLLLGVDIRALTFFHAVEEIIRPLLPFDPFTRETWNLQSRDADGTCWPTTTHLFNPEWSRRRDLRLIVPDLIARGYYHEEKLHRLKAILLGCREFLETLEQLAKAGKTCYHQELLP
ncbi:MAG: AAC(3) family N-acetyltransferase [Magnetococcales bacterium]|nr:AAC(3) family N-acetyltransferase [Magnetococcales bacterium]